MRQFHTLCMTATVSGLVLVLACSGSKTEENPTEAPPAVETPTIAVGSEVGNRAPAFSLPSAHGETVALADYGGKPVAVVFYRGQW